MACRDNAIEHVDAARHRIYDVNGCTHAHQVAWMIDRHCRNQIVEHCDAFFFRLSDSQSADRVTVKPDLCESCKRLLAKIGVDAALYDAEKRFTAIGRRCA